MLRLWTIIKAYSRRAAGVVDLINESVNQYQLGARQAHSRPDRAFRHPSPAHADDRLRSTCLS